MKLPWSRPVSFVNARVVLPDGVASTLRFSSSVLAVDTRPRAGDAVVDLNGAFVLPGLINAHDHLELNHYGQLRPKERYENASAWIDDLRPVLARDLNIQRNMAYPLSARLFIGGLKNVLSGVTTVAHHNPRYRELGGWYPTRIVQRYGWAHSFSLEQQAVGARGELGGDVRERCRSTPVAAPFIMHVGEGIDQAAAGELPRLERLGCLRENTVLVHGVALGPSDWIRVVARGSALVWCPASNLFLFGTTAPIREFLDASATAWTHLCLGTDSRVTGARDMLDELKAAARAAPIASEDLLRAVTDAPARVLKIPNTGRIAVNSPADLVVVPPLRDNAAEALLAASRRDLSLVTIGGRPMVGSPAFRAAFEARGAFPRLIAVDDRERLADWRLARAIARCPIAEPGVACLS